MGIRSPKWRTFSAPEFFLMGGFQGLKTPGYRILTPSGLRVRLLLRRRLTITGRYLLSFPLVKNVRVWVGIVFGFDVGYNRPAV
jgi:hypothetical protein